MVVDAVWNYTPIILQSKNFYTRSQYLEKSLLQYITRASTEANPVDSGPISS